MTDDEDEVGYGKPPRKHQFKKGVSGNPSGRRARSKSFDALIEQQLDAKVVVNSGGRKARVPLRQAVLMKIASDALNGKVRAQEILLKHMRERGKPDPLGTEAYDEGIFAEFAATLAPPSADKPEDK
ncbi:DUF5681 domain-containing protein [Methylobacterium mesophilicum]